MATQNRRVSELGAVKMSCSYVLPWITFLDKGEEEEEEGGRGENGFEFQRTNVCLSEFPAPLMLRGGWASKHGGIDSEIIFCCVFLQEGVCFLCLCMCGLVVRVHVAVRLLGGGPLLEQYSKMRGAAKLSPTRKLIKWKGGTLLFRITNSPAYCA